MTTNLTPDTILAGTAVLAPFDGWVKDEILSNKTWTFYVKEGKVKNDDEFTYHTSYDALHGVWDKLRKLNDIEVGTSTWCDYTDKCARIATALAYDSIEKCFSLLVEAVEWLQKTKGGSDVH